MEGKFNYFGTLIHNEDAQKLVDKLPVNPIIKKRMAIEKKSTELSELVYDVSPALNVVNADYVIIPVPHKNVQVRGYYGEKLPFAFQEGNLSVIYEGKTFILKSGK
ncbi:MAG: hypothetical protein ACP5NW_00825 [Candidatus Woesearchaeota archaeon]